MAVDTSIYQMAGRGVKSVADYDAEYAQTRQSKLAELVGGMKMQGMQQELQDAQTARQDKLTLADLFRKNTGADGVVNQSGLYAGMAGAGQGAGIAGMRKTQGEADKLAAQTQGEQWKNTASIASARGSAAGAILQNPTYENAIAILTDLKSRMPADHAAQMDLSKVPRDPALIKQWAEGTYRSGIDADKQLADATSRSNNKANNDTSIANNQASNATSRANNAATVGASYANAGATRAVAASNVEAARLQRDQATEMKLGDDYRAQSKDFKAVGDAYKQINSTLDKATTSPAATLAAATKFMKLLDPGSVVRESELGMALAATGAFDRATNYVNTLRYGKVLTANQAADFKNITQQIYGAAQAGQKDVDANYRRQAEAYKLRPDMIIQDLGQNAAPVKPSAGKVVNFGDLK